MMAVTPIPDQRAKLEEWRQLAADADITPTGVWWPFEDIDALIHLAERLGLKNMANAQFHF